MSTAPGGITGLDRIAQDDVLRGAGLIDPRGGSTSRCETGQSAPAGRT
jgi:hypothetical protein